MYDGPMFSSKTESLIDELNTKRPVYKFLVKPILDTRSYMTHGKKCLKWQIRAITLDKMREILSLNMIDDYLICIDEAQFYGEEIIDFIDSIKTNSHITCRIALLDYTFELKEWPIYIQLKSLGIKEKKLTANCQEPECDYAVGSAIYTRLNIDPKLVKDGVLIGGHEAYSAICRQCHQRLVREGKIIIPI